MNDHKLRSSLIISELSKSAPQKTSHLPLIATCTVLSDSCPHHRSSTAGRFLPSFPTSRHLFFDQTLIFHNDKQIDRSIDSLSVSLFFSFLSITESWLHQLQLGFLLEPLHCFFFCWWLSTSAGLSTGSSLQPFTTFDTINRPSNKGSRNSFSMLRDRSVGYMTSLTRDSPTIPAFRSSVRLLIDGFYAFSIRISMDGRDDQVSFFLLLLLWLADTK